MTGCLDDVAMHDMITGPCTAAACTIIACNFFKYTGWIKTTVTRGIWINDYSSQKSCCNKKNGRYFFIHEYQ